MRNQSMQHILFDTDGVIVHSKMWSLEFAQRSGISSDEMLPFFRGLFQDCIVGKADIRTVIEPFLKIWNYSGTPDEFLHEWFHYENHIDKELIERIQKLRKSWIYCHVATNQEAYRLSFLKNEMRFSEYFDSVFCSCEIGYKKPQEEFYEYILSSLNVSDPNKVLYFDDAPESIESAASLGIRAYLYHSIEDFERNNRYSSK